MTLLDALLLIRDAATTGKPMDGRKGDQALKVVNHKITALSRKKLWREQTDFARTSEDAGKP